MGVEVRFETIQILTPETAKQLLEIYRGCEDFLALGPQPRASLEMAAADFAHAQSVGSHFGLLFDEDGAPVGVLDFLPQADAIYLELLMIPLKRRGQGYGRAALGLVEARARAEGKRRVDLHVQTNHPAGIRFWEGCGFRFRGEAAWQPDGTHTRPMTLWLRD